MGWSDCGKDSRGRRIGYGFPAKCDHRGCRKRIDRGLAYACGGMHGQQDTYGEVWVCEGYFCENHRVHVELKSGNCVSVCLACEKTLEKEGALAPEDTDAE